MSTTEDLFFEAVASRELVRPSVRAIVEHDGSVLVQRPADDASGRFAFIGGEYEWGDTFDARIRKEFEEETTANVVTWKYLFVVENRFRHGRHQLHTLEHYLQVELDTTQVQSREAHLTQHWLEIDSLAEVDLRPRVVRDALLTGDWTTRRHLAFDEWEN